MDSFFDDETCTVCGFDDHTSDACPSLLPEVICGQCLRRGHSELSCPVYGSSSAEPSPPPPITLPSKTSPSSERSNNGLLPARCRILATTSRARAPRLPTFHLFDSSGRGHRTVLDRILTCPVQISPDLFSCATRHQSVEVFRWSETADDIKSSSLDFVWELRNRLPLRLVHSLNILKYLPSCDLLAVGANNGRMIFWKYPADEARLSSETASFGRFSGATGMHRPHVCETVVLSLDWMHSQPTALFSSARRDMQPTVFQAKRAEAAERSIDARIGITRPFAMRHGWRSSEDGFCVKCFDVRRIGHAVRHSAVFETGLIGGQLAHDSSRQIIFGTSQDQDDSTTRNGVSWIDFRSPSQVAGSVLIPKNRITNYRILYDEPHQLLIVPRRRSVQLFDVRYSRSLLYTFDMEDTDYPTYTCLVPSYNAKGHLGVAVASRNLLSLLDATKRKHVWLNGTMTVSGLCPLSSSWSPELGAISVDEAEERMMWMVSFLADYEPGIWVEIVFENGSAIEMTRIALCRAMLNPL